MQLYSYTAKNPETGEVVKAAIQAESEAAAASLIHKEGLVPTKISVEGGAGGLHVPLPGRKGIKIKDKVLFSRQLSTLINAGLPLVQALRNVLDQTQNKRLRMVLEQVIADVEAGSALSESLAKHPEAFNQIYVSLVQAGETSGTLDKSLERLALQQEKDADVISKVRGALVYPVIVLFVMIGVVTYMLLTVLPQVQVLYEGTPGGVASLPIFTKVLLFVSDIIKNFWWAIIIAFGALGFAGTKWARTGPGKDVVDKIKMKMPLFGKLFMKMYMARFARTGTTLVASGVPLIQVLEITGKAVNNVHIERSIIRATEQVKGGKSLSSTIEGDPHFLPLVPSMLKIGEESGASEQMLEKVATYYEKEVDDQIKAISTIIEPFMMILMGISALIIVAAVLLPVYTLSGDSLVK
jgi:type IV pilus assembly protein PilC